MDEEQQDTGTSPKPSKFKSEWIVAGAAIGVSILTMFVYIYQAKIMQEQQHTSVWPYLEWTATMSTTDGFYISVVNKGVGPAIVKKTRLMLDGKETNSTQLVHDLFGDSLWVFKSRIDERVFAPGEEIRLFHVKDGENKKLIIPEDPMARIKYEIIFVSIYGDCWTSKGLTVEEGGCD